MSETHLKNFGATAQGLSRNPLGIIALFIVLVYGLACLVVITGGSLSQMERIPIIYFLIFFPLIVLGVFTYLVSLRSGQLFAPSDFREERTYLELQRMQLSAVASLAAAKQTKGTNRDNLNANTINRVVQSVESVMEIAKSGAKNLNVLWFDDNPNNNTSERSAMEAMGIKFTLSEPTADALNILAHHTFGAIISDMGRREGAREGYKLLDALRSRGNKTPLFFFASSNTPEHKQETYEHGGQGCTNDGQELFDMVINTIFGARTHGIHPIRRH